MNLLNTIALPNQHVAHGQDYIAVYADGVVSTYRKNRIDNTVDLQPVTYSVDGVLSLRMSQNGQIIAVQTATQTIRLQNGTQTPFNNIGRFDIANTGHLIIVDAVNGAVQVITNSTTNLATTVTDDDRVVCGRQGYMVYNTARTLLGAKFADVTFTNTPAAKEIVHCLHVKDDKYAIFYKDGTATYDGITRTVAGPFAGFREAGSHLLSTDYKQDFYTSRFNPLSDAKSLRTFTFVPPAQLTDAQLNAYNLLVPGSVEFGADFDIKNNLAVYNRSAVTIANDAPFGNTGKSLNFDGSASFLQTADSANIQLGGADFTVELFVKIASGATGVITVLNKGGGLNVSWSSFILQAITATKSFCFAASTSNTKYEVGSTDGVGAWGSFEYDTWTHIAITRKVNVWRCFQDGKLQAKYNVAGSVFANSGRGLSIGHSRQNDFNSGALYGLLKGRLHGLAILNYAKYTSNFVVDSVPVDRIPLLDWPLAGSVPAGVGWGGYNIQANYTDKLFITLSPAQYIDPTLAVKSLPAVTFPQTGVEIQSLTNSVIVSSRPYSGDYKVSTDGGQTWTSYTPPNGTSGAGRAIMFKGALYLQHNQTGTVTTIRKFASLPAQTFTDTPVSANNLFDVFCFDGNENAIVASPEVGGNTALYISWNGTTYTPYETGIPTAGVRVNVYYVGNNVFMIVRSAAPASISFIYVPKTQGAPTVIGTIATTVKRVMQFTDKLAIATLSRLYVKPISKRVDGYNATLAEAQQYYTDIIGTFNTVPYRTINSGSYAPWYTQDKLVCRDTNDMRIYEMKKEPDAATIAYNTWMQMRFTDGTSLEEVSGVIAPIAATASVVNSKLVNTDATVTVMDKLTPVYFSAVEDFSVEGWFNFSSVDPAFAATILCVDASNGDADRSFNLNIYPTGNTAGFILSANGATGGYSLNGTYAFQANTDHHLAACRVNGVLTIYLDGAPIYSGANNTASFKSTQFLNVRRGAVGKRWGLRVVRGASAYNQVFTPPVTLPALVPNYYQFEVQNDIVFQTSFRGNSANEEVTKTPLTFSGAGITVSDGRLKISQTGSTSRFEKFIPYFGAGDFTIDVLLRVVSTAANENCIMGQYVNPGQNNSWLMWYSAGMGFIFYSNSTAGGLVGLTATKTLPVNTDVHLVIEKFNGVLTIYMDGVACGTVAHTQPLSDNSSVIPVRNWWGDNSMSNTMHIKYIRIAKRAMYQGAVRTKAALPLLV
jgi:hypothetical protein